MGKVDRVNLTPNRIASANCQPGKQQTFLWDKESPRLAVRITAKSKSFIFETKLNRKTIRWTIGACSAWTIEDARKEANRLQTLVDRDIDPRRQRQEEREAREAEDAARKSAMEEQEARKKYTLRKLFESYTDFLEKNGKITAAKNAKSAFKCHLLEKSPELADTFARDVTAEQLAEVFRSIVDQGKKRTAGTLRSYLSAAFNAAKKAPFDPNLPTDLKPFGITQNPAELTGNIRTEARNRVLSAEELKHYLCRLGDSPVDMALRLAIFSGGQRMKQILRLKLSDFDEQTKTLRLFDPKGRRSKARIHKVPLWGRAAAIVRSLIDRAEEMGSEHLFASTKNTLIHHTTVGARVSEISKSMGGEPFDLRDIRRTAETMLAGMGISQDIRAQLLSHGVTGIQAAHYDRYDYTKEKRSALRRWEQHLQRISNSEEPAKVVDIGIAIER